MKHVTTQPAEVTIVYVQAVLTPNGEVVYRGKTLGWFDREQPFLYTDA